MLPTVCWHTPAECPARPRDQPSQAQAARNWSAPAGGAGERPVRGGGGGAVSVRMSGAQPLAVATKSSMRPATKRHDISRNLIRVWVEKYEAGAFDEDATAADLIQAYEARIAALERLVGRQALELEFQKRGRCAPHRGQEAGPRP